MQRGHLLKKAQTSSRGLADVLRSEALVGVRFQGLFASHFGEWRKLKISVVAIHINNFGDWYVWQ